ncbi:C6 zinc finger domain containing protein [Ilyonectria robusta]
MSSPRAVSARQRKPAVEDTEARAQSETKRRKIRKGTHSCWECKRRKMKCIFDPLVNGSCNGCRRRGSKCVGEEFSEEVSPHLDKTDRVMRVETLVDQLIQQTGGNGTTSDRRTPMTPSEDGRRTDPVLLTPASMDSESLPFLAFYKSSNVRIRDSGIPCLSLTAWIGSHNQNGKPSS